MTRTRIGICGCGEVTQIIHLPALAQLDDLFEVTALCDVSDEVLTGVGARLPWATRYSEPDDLVRDNNVDAVLIATPHAYHAATAIAALRAGKHVFVEKPMAMTLADADAIAKEEAASGCVVQVGYMRRYAGAFQAAVEIVRAARAEVRFARVHDFIGANRLIIDDTSRVIRGTDVSDVHKEQLTRLNAELTHSAIGTLEPALAQAYGLLLGLSSHDVSAMRELLGPPKGVLHASQRAGGRYITASFDFGDFVCDFATGVDRLPRFDTFIEVYCTDRLIRVAYDTPYVRNLPAVLTVTEPDGAAGIRQSVSFPSRIDSFVVEWRAFHDAVAGGTKPKTGVEDSRQDLEIFAKIMARLSDQGAPAGDLAVA